MFTNIFISCREKKLKQDFHNSKKFSSYIDKTSNMEEIILLSKNENAFNHAVKKMLMHQIDNYLESNISPIEIYTSNSAKTILDNTDWRIILNEKDIIIFDVSWFKYSRRNMNDKGKFWTSHKDYYDLDTLLTKDLHTPLLKVITKNILNDFEKLDIIPENEKKYHQKYLLQMINQNNFEGIIRILINQFLEYGNKILSLTDIEAISKSINGQMPLFKFLVFKSNRAPHREIFTLLEKPDHIYHIEEKDLLTSYRNFVSFICKDKQFTINEITAKISPSLVAIIHVYERISKEFSNLIKQTKITQRIDNDYMKVSDINGEIIKKLFRMLFMRKLKKIMIFHLIKCMQKKRVL